MKTILFRVTDFVFWTNSFKILGFSLRVVTLTTIHAILHRDDVQ